MATHHQATAKGIQRQLDASIFSDDADAIEALQARITEREAEASRIKTYNASCRKAAKVNESHGDLSLLDEHQTADLLSIMRACPYQVRAGGMFPSYALSNLRQRIKADKDRLAIVKQKVSRDERAEESENGYVIEGKRWVSITFAEKPEREILTALKSAGFRWRQGSWNGPRESIPSVLKP